jgi:hypothetical protein
MAEVMPLDVTAAKLPNINEEFPGDDMASAVSALNS